MNKGRLIDALALPADARVDQRVPKKLLLEEGAVTATDKKYIQDGIEEIVWVAALKPTSVGVAAYRDEIREYLEIAVLVLTLRPEAKTSRLVELIHRAIPYPVVLITVREDRTALSLAHQRFAQNEPAKRIIDGNIVSVDFGLSEEIEEVFLAGLALAAQPSQNLYVLYHHWIERIEALMAARVTGRFVEAKTREQALSRKEALGNRALLERELASLRAQAIKEKQMNRKVELNLEIKKIGEKIDSQSKSL